jgi:hypothetical protein
MISLILANEPAGRGHWPQRPMPGSILPGKPILSRNGLPLKEKDTLTQHTCDRRRLPPPRRENAPAAVGK